MEDISTYKENFDRQEAARRLGVSVITIDRLTAAGRLRHFRIGRRILFCQAHLTEFLTTREIPPRDLPTQRYKKR